MKETIDHLEECLQFSPCGFDAFWRPEKREEALRFIETLRGHPEQDLPDPAMVGMAIAIFRATEDTLCQIG